jgi:hypothetical protein
VSLVAFSALARSHGLLWVLLPAALTLTACDAPVVGSWQSDVKLTDGSRNTMNVDSDLSGSAKIHATPASDTTAWVGFKFDFTGAEKDDGITWQFAMECVSGDCVDEDFKMDCQVIDEGSDPVKMNCVGRGRWASYPFDWEAVDN